MHMTSVMWNYDVNFEQIACLYGMPQSYVSIRVACIHYLSHIHTSTRSSNRQVYTVNIPAAPLYNIVIMWHYIITHQTTTMQVEDSRVPVHYRQIRILRLPSGQPKIQDRSSVQDLGSPTLNVCLSTPTVMHTPY